MEIEARRNPGQPIISIDEQIAEARFGSEPADEEDPSRAFERRWACLLIERVLQQLKANCEAEGRSDLFQVLHPHLTGEAERGDFAGAAAKLNLTEGAARVAAVRLRGRFRELLRGEIESLVASAADVDAEIDYLFALFSR